MSSPLQFISRFATESIMAEPAWKKLGLKVSDSGDSGVSVAHIDSAQLTNRDVKAINKQKRKLEHGNNGTKKPPKRVKVPKSERKPPPEKDQLFYLRQYTTDRDNWKFSKQKQNWILKNIETIPEKYHHDLIAYLEGIQGGSRLRLLEEMQAVVERWNAAGNAAEEKIKEKGNGEKTEENGEEKSEKSEGNESEKEGPTYTYAVRCRDIIKALTEEFFPLSGVDEIESDEKNEPEETEEKAEFPESHDEEDNLIIEEVDVAGVQPEPPLAFEKKEHEEEEGKEKKKKKKKDTSK